jgi:hypothetical protein
MFSAGSPNFERYMQQIEQAVLAPAEKEHAAALRLFAAESLLAQSRPQVQKGAEVLLERIAGKKSRNDLDQLADTLKSAAFDILSDSARFSALEGLPLPPTYAVYLRAKLAFLSADANRAAAVSRALRAFAVGGSSKRAVEEYNAALDWLRITSVGVLAALHEASSHSDSTSAKSLASIRASRNEIRKDARLTAVALGTFALSMFLLYQLLIYGITGRWAVLRTPKTSRLPKSQ